MVIFALSWHFSPHPKSGTVKNKVHLYASATQLS